MIQLDSLSFYYTPDIPIFQGFSWRIEAGEAWAVLGPSGCGKSTLLYLLAGLRLPNEGEVRINGEAITRPRPRTGLILQDYGLLPWATVEQNASLGLRIREFYGPDGTHAPPQTLPPDLQQKARAWVDDLGLAHVQDQYPGQISGGQRQRTAIARTLALDPDLLLMDEPFASLDAPTRESLQALVHRLRAEHHLTTVIITHAIEEAAILGNKILVLGQPPNTAPTIFENPRASEPGYPSTPAYTEICTQLRQALETAP